MDIHAVGSISVHLKVVSAKTSQVYNNNVIWITYDCHRNSNKITNLHAQEFIIDSNKITLEKKIILSSRVEQTAPMEVPS